MFISHQIPTILLFPLFYDNFAMTKSIKVSPLKLKEGDQKITKNLRKVPFLVINISLFMKRSCVFLHFNSTLSIVLLELLVFDSPCSLGWILLIFQCLVWKHQSTSTSQNLQNGEGRLLQSKIVFKTFVSKFIFNFRNYFKRLI